MGWVSFLEDIEKRLDDAVVRLSSPPDTKRGSISIESLLDTNDLLRRRNDDLLKLIYTLKAGVSSKKQTDFCKSECVRIRKVNDLLVRRLDNRKTDTAPLTPNPKINAAASRQPEKIEPSSSLLRESKQRFLDAARVVESAKQDLKQAQRTRTKAQNEYQGLLQSERNSTKYVHDSGHSQRQRHPTSRSPR